MLWRWLVLAGCAGVGLILAGAMLQLPEPPVRIAVQVDATLHASGVTSKVTAVLLNFRGYDTLLEIAVLLLALIGVLAMAGDARSNSLRLSVSPQPILQSMTRVLAPLMMLVAGYLLWAGSHRPGGAFQAGSVLAAGGVLLYLAGLLPAWAAPGRLLRSGLAAGFMIFLAVAAGSMINGSMLQYPPRHAGALILLIEAGLTVSLGLILAGLFLWLPNENEEAEE
ncbi:MAG: hypothetical protein A3I66_24270 [Burkholderiales bacterium RIFCSPLOWO2_02_FULL_57_36]|nr:MAG: hypothetical protein A3I66_24270 [Burkholderiales bacterium RIFCSPLOWO2_02_FULL_57_36]